MVISFPIPEWALPNLLRNKPMDFPQHSRQVFQDFMIPTADNPQPHLTQNLFPSHIFGRPDRFPQNLDWLASFPIHKSLTESRHDETCQVFFTLLKWTPSLFPRNSCQTLRVFSAGVIFLIKNIQSHRPWMFFNLKVSSTQQPSQMQLLLHLPFVP